MLRKFERVVDSLFLDGLAIVMLATLFYYARVGWELTRLAISLLSIEEPNHFIWRRSWRCCPLLRCGPYPWRGGRSKAINPVASQNLREAA